MTERFRPVRVSTAPIALPEPPAYLSRVPDAIMAPRVVGTFARDLDDWLAAYGIDARPTLIEVAAERARRGLVEPLPPKPKARRGAGSAARRAIRRAAEADEAAA